MGVHTNIEGDDFTAIDLRAMADDMLAKVVADHAAQRFEASNRANADIAGDYVAYTVSIDGKQISSGRGSLLPRYPIQVAVFDRAKSGRREQNIKFDWMWDSLGDSALRRALEGYMRINRAYDDVRDVGTFIRLVINVKEESAELFLFLLERYARRRFPKVFASLDRIRAIYRVYRAVRIGRKLIGHSREETSNEDVLKWIARELRDRSPVLTGAYRDAHALYGDGQFLMSAGGIGDDTVIDDADEYSFTNALPYSRKIEFGKTKDGRDFVIQVPSHIYERVANDAREEFGDIADISYELRGIVGDEQITQSSSRSSRNRRDVRFPAVIVRFK